ncbi:MAG TPA: hypothetical protein VMD08_09950 [Candidatus Baltobacteraceae bacterium]|nr:hypothetical protein [Candidatus Baltobacteraceae bacterium]
MPDDAIRGRVRMVLAPLRVVYAAMLGSILVYWVVVQVIRMVARIPRGRDVFAAVDWLRFPLYGLGAIACVAVFIMRRKLFDRERLLRQTRGRNLPEILSLLSSNQILVFAVAEAPVVLGLVLYFVGGYLFDFYALAAASVLAFALAFPSSRDWEDALDQLRTARPELFASRNDST